MARQPADQAQRDRALTELDTCFLVEAAAGTGKTTLLVGRIMALLRRRSARLTELVAITFTEKAAGELKVRLREEIEAALREASGAARDGFRRALADLDRMTVCTIHSFCAELLRERPVEGRVDPGFVVADELASSLLFRETWDAWLAGQMQPDNAPLRRAIEFGVSFEDHAYGPSKLSWLAGLLNDNRDLAVSLCPEGADEPEAFGPLAAGAGAKIQALAELAATECRSNDDAAAVHIRGLAAWARGLAGPQFDEVIRWGNLMPKLKKGKVGNQKNWGDLATVRERLNEAQIACEDLRSRVSHRVIIDLIQWAMPFLERYAAAKAARRMLDFQDLLLLARDMLKGSRPARGYFKRKIRYLLIDEFQDTDPLQTEIAFFLAEQEEDFAETWEAAALKPGKLFLVGDPKQSIYGFRRADLDLYGKVKERIQTQGGILTLSVNFRTVPQVIGEVNKVFEPLMTGPVNGRFEPSHVPLVAFRNADGQDAGVRLAFPPANLDTAGWKSEDWRRVEAGCIASAIREMVDRGTPVYDKTSGAPGWRPVQYGDMAVIFRATTNLDDLERAFRAHDVPYQIAGGKHYYARQEFQNLLCVLKAVENPHDSLSVLAALRSPFFGHSDADILRHSGCGGGFNYLNPVPREWAGLAKAFETLRELHAMRNQASARHVLTRLFDRTKALQVYAMKPHGEQRVANLLKVMDLARTVQNAENETFAGVVRWLGRMESEAQAEGESPVAEADENVVQFLTFHKAKGLEFPVVFIAFMGSGSSTPDDFVFTRGETPALELRLPGDTTTLGWEAASADKKDRAEHERRRLFYVALTRARDQLVLPIGWWKKAEGLLEYVQAVYPASQPEEGAPWHDRMFDTSRYELGKRATDRFALRVRLEDAITPAACAFAEHRRQWSERMTRRMGALAQARTALSPSALAESLEPAAVAEGDSEKGKRIGTLAHAILERIDFNQPGDALSLARRFAVEADDVDIVVPLVKRALEMPVMRRAARAERVFRELPFTMLTEDGQPSNGVVDLVFMDSAGAVIVDYKADQCDVENVGDRAQHHAPQIKQYAKALTQILGQPVREAWLLFLRPGLAERVALE